MAHVYFSPEQVLSAVRHAEWKERKAAEEKAARANIPLSDIKLPVITIRRARWWDTWGSSWDGMKGRIVSIDGVKYLNSDEVYGKHDDDWVIRHETSCWLIRNGYTSASREYDRAQKPPRVAQR